MLSDILYMYLSRDIHVNALRIFRLLIIFKKQTNEQISSQKIYIIARTIKL